ncbi:MAG: transketolase [Firmicutes bacterium]|nr:transketolase [Bacillota bacterium]
MAKKSYTNEEIQRTANKIRKQVLKFAIERGGCYITQTNSSAEVLATLYLDVMNLGDSLGDPDGIPFPGVPGPDNMDFPRGSLYNGPTQAPYDRFFLSPAHYACTLYCTLFAVGRVSETGIERFNKDGWIFEQIGAEHSPGFETTAGSLAQTISVACGHAHGRKLKGEEGTIWCFMSDGELEEGQLWEAVQAAAFYKLDNFVLVCDINGQQIEGPTKEIMNTQPLYDRFTAFGAKTVEIDGHDIQAIKDACRTAHPGQPLVVLCNTKPTHGMPFLDHRTERLHFVNVKTPEQIAEAKAFYDSME